jgi:hypothetical protein
VGWLHYHHRRGVAPPPDASHPIGGGGVGARRGDSADEAAQ